MIANFLRRVGFLRAALMFVTLLLVLVAPFAGGYVQTSGWPLVTTLIAPVSLKIGAVNSLFEPTEFSL